jgi:hypothetical protein
VSVFLKLGRVYRPWTWKTCQDEIADAVSHAGGNIWA